MNHSAARFPASRSRILFLAILIRASHEYSLRGVRQFSQHLEPEIGEKPGEMHLRDGLPYQTSTAILFGILEVHGAATQEKNAPRANTGSVPRAR